MPSKKQMQKPSRIESTAVRLGKRGINVRQFVDHQGSFLVGVAAFGYGLMLLTGAGLVILWPAAALAIPLCATNPWVASSIAIVALIGGFAVMFLSSRGLGQLTALDDKFILTWRSGKTTILRWYDIDGWYECPFFGLLIRRRSGGVVRIPSSHTGAWGDFRMLLTLAEFRSTDLSVDRPSLLTAITRLKRDMIGPGVVVPKHNAGSYRDIERRLRIYSLGGTAALGMTVLGWVSAPGPALGVAALILTLVADILTGQPYPAGDTVIVRKDHLLIRSPEDMEESIAMSDIEAWGSQADTVSLGISGQKEVVDMTLDPRSAELLLQVILLAKSIKPPALVHTVAEDGKLAA